MPVLPQAPRGLPIKDLERLWLDTTCLYEEFAEIVLLDTDWDLMGKELYERRREWSPYFKNCLPSPAFNPGTTGSGIDWVKGIPRLVREQLSLLDGNYSPVYDKWMAVFERFHRAPVRPLGEALP